MCQDMSIFHKRAFWILGELQAESQANTEVADLTVDTEQVGLDKHVDLDDVLRPLHLHAQI